MHSRSLHTYRRAACVPEADGMERGSPFNYSPQRMQRARDSLSHASKDWERRHSGSPVRRESFDVPRSDSNVPRSDYDYMVSPDPLADHYFWASTPRSPHRKNDDPMSLEASDLDTALVAALRYSSDHYGEPPHSPAYVSVCALWASNQPATNASEAQAEVVFGPGV